MNWIVGGVLGLGALLWILWPLARRGGPARTRRADGAAGLAEGGGAVRDGGAVVDDDLAERTLLLYQELEEIDLEHEQGDLSDDEYAALREAQKGRVLAVLEQRQRAAGAAREAEDPGDDIALHRDSGRSDANALSDAIEDEILRIRAQRRGERAASAGQPSAALAPARGMHWLWLGVPAALVLIAFGVIFQLYQSSARTLTEQTPIAQIEAAALVGFAYLAPNHVLLASANGLRESRDGGRSWTESALDAAPTALATAPGAAARGYAYVFTADSVLATADAGETWQEVQGTLPGADVLAAAVNPFMPTEVYAGFAGAGLYRSRDGGRTWEPVATPDDEPVVAIFVGSIPPLLFIAGESGNVRVSSDEGATWRAASGAVTMALRGPVRALSGAPDASVLYAASHTGLYMSTSAGQTWIDLPLRKPLAAVAVDPADARTVLAVTESGEVYRSTDGGIAWRDE